jgi:hypothetical protein
MSHAYSIPEATREVVDVIAASRASVTPVVRSRSPTLRNSNPIKHARVASL